MTTARAHAKSRVRKEEEITQTDFDGESRRHRRITTSRAKAMAKALENYLKAEARKQIKIIVTELRRKGIGSMATVRKGVDDWDDERLLRILQLYGVRQIVDVGTEFAGSEWLFTPQAQAKFMADKGVQVQGIRRNLEKEMRTSIGAALGTWMDKEPELTVQQVSRRLRDWLLVPQAKDTPPILKPLGQRFTSHGIGARAKMIARTEINQARNRGRLEAGKITGATHYMWLAMNDGLSGPREHDALDGQVQPAGSLFVNPSTGVELAYPGDPGADAEEIINCRCSIRPLTAAQAADFGA